MPSRRLLPAVALVFAFVTACSGSSSPTPTNTPSVTPSPTPTPPTAAESLAALAHQGLQASYSAIYGLRQRHGSRIGLERVYRRPPTAYRVDNCCPGLLARPL